jgi:hypothetical protein
VEELLAGRSYLNSFGEFCPVEDIHLNVRAPIQSIRMHIEYPIGTVVKSRQTPNGTVVKPPEPAIGTVVNPRKNPHRYRRTDNPDRLPNLADVPNTF